MTAKTQTRHNLLAVPDRPTTTFRKTWTFAVRVVRKFVSQPGEALLLCRMAWWVSVLSIAARCYSLPRALTIVAGSKTNQTLARDEAAQQRLAQQRLARVIDLLLSADFFLFKPICWKRAAVLHRYLSRHGIATRIIFGVRHDADGKVAGHAWLEAEGEPILESAPPEYVVTYRFPSNEHFDPQLATVTLE